MKFAKNAAVIDPEGDGLPEGKLPKEVKLRGVLQPGVHERLFLNIERYAQDAGIMPAWIWKPIEDTCRPDEILWFRRFRFHQGEGSAGLLYVGAKPKVALAVRMAALAGALTRNFVYGRVMPLHQLIEATLAGDPPLMSCLLVPNFFTGDSGLPAWRSAVLLDVLLHRQLQGLQTVLYVSDLTGLAMAYGEGMRQHLQAYQQLEA